MYPIIGVTEGGDPSLNLSWIPKIIDVDGVVVITKNIAPLQPILLKHSDKIILHATITGWGGSQLEPNTPHWLDSFRNLKELIQAGFPLPHVVVRINPIIPTGKGLMRADIVMRTIAAYHFPRIRISVLDVYPHVRERLRKIGSSLPFNGFQADSSIFEEISELCRKCRKDFPYTEIETCAETGLKGVRHCGCISEYDLNILNIPYDSVDSIGPQRTGCMCYSGKRELLNWKTQCPYGCLYCYWKDPK